MLLTTAGKAPPILIVIGTQAFNAPSAGIASVCTDTAPTVSEHNRSDTSPAIATVPVVCLIQKETCCLVERSSSTVAKYAASPVVNPAAITNESDTSAHLNADVLNDAVTLAD